MSNCWIFEGHKGCACFVCRAHKRNVYSPFPNTLKNVIFTYASFHFCFARQKLGELLDAWKDLVRPLKIHLFRNLINLNWKQYRQQSLVHLCGKKFIEVSFSALNSFFHALVLHKFLAFAFWEALNGFERLNNWPTAYI